MRRVYVLQFRCCSLPECCVGYELQMCCGLSKLNWSSCGLQWRTVHCFCACFQMEHLCHKLCLVFASATSIPHIKSLQWGSRTQLKSLQTQTVGILIVGILNPSSESPPLFCASAPRSRMGKQEFSISFLFLKQSLRGALSSSHSKSSIIFSVLWIFIIIIIVTWTAGGKGLDFVCCDFFTRPNLTLTLTEGPVSLGRKSSTPRLSCLLCPLSCPCHLLARGVPPPGLTLSPFFSRSTPNWHSSPRAPASPVGSKLGAGEPSTRVDSNPHNCPDIIVRWGAWWPPW